MQKYVTIQHTTHQIKDLRLKDPAPTDPQVLQLIQDWVDDLRSGSRVQGTRSLRRLADPYTEHPDEFCCLGVLCEVAGLEKTISLNSVMSYDNEMTGLPLRFRETVGFTSKLVRVTDLAQPDKPLNLAWLNDKGATFEQIAKIIAQSWLGEPA